MTNEVKATTFENTTIKYRSIGLERGVLHQLSPRVRQQR